MAKLLEMVRNSPLAKRRAGGYSVMEKEAKDPFIQGISFHAHFVGSCEVESKHDNPDVQDALKKLWGEVHKSGKHLPKVVLTVKATSLRVKDANSKQVDDYPIYLVSYCGASKDVDQLFYFIYKSRIDRVLRAEVYKLSHTDKVTALTLTVAKAFNIAFKAWMSDKRKREREAIRGSESPLIQRRQLGHQNGDGGSAMPSHLAKIAPGVATKSSGPYTPPVVRKVDPATEDSKPKRSGSLGDIPGEAAAQNPAVMRVHAHNESTGSTHDITLTDEFDKEFQQLAVSRATPEVLETSVPHRPETFDLDQIKQHVDSDSVEDLVQLGAQ